MGISPLIPKSDGRSKALHFIKFENGCTIPWSHTLNQDGYFRIYLGDGAPQRLMMFHRLVWLLQRGEIPEGYEVDHVCRCRACCNPEHLQLLERGQHKSKGNAIRYKHIIEKGRKMWQEGRSVEEIAEACGRKPSTVLRWFVKFRRAAS